MDLLLLSQGIPEPLPHLGRRLIGKCNRCNLPGLYFSIFYQIQDMADQGLGLSRAWPRDYGYRPGCRPYCPLLLAVEPVRQRQFGA